MQPEIIKLIKKYACHSEAKENSTGNNAYILSYKKRFSVHIVLEKKKQNNKPSPFEWSKHYECMLYLLNYFCSLKSNTQLWRITDTIFRFLK